MKTILLAIAGLAIANHACQARTCDADSRPTRTPFGLLEKFYCKASTHEPTTYYISLDGVKILQDDFLRDVTSDKSWAYWIYEGGGSQDTGCTARHYLVDISVKPARVITFGVKSACNEFHWARWGKKRSVIAIKDNVKFTYENGKLIPPMPGPELYEYIKPNSMRMTPVEQFIPFVEDVPPPATR
jgi:hypothetical protein